jgi:DNA-binding Lrp family transcriptional regulator
MPHKTDIDEIDAKILKTLLNESRTSFTEIAKDCKISVPAVRMRFKHLWKTGIINGETMLVNPHSLGYEYIAHIGITTTREDEGIVTEFLESKPYVPSVLRDFGKYNLTIQVALHNIGELSKIQRELEAHPLIKHVDSFIWDHDIVIEHPENLIIKPFSSKIEPKHIAVKEAEIKMDETDKKIAKILTQKSRTPFRQIAQQLGISTKNVIERYRKLRENVLTLSAITVDLNKLGYAGGVFVFMKLANKSMRPEVVTELLRIPNLIALFEYIGIYDLFAHVVLEDFQDYFKMADSLKRIEDIDQLDIFLVPNFPAWPLNLFAFLL